AKHFSKFGIAQPEIVTQRQAGRSAARRKCAFPGNFREAIPGTSVQAIITAEDAVANKCPELERRASKRCGPVMAPVGQAVIQRSHVPQRSRCGGSGGSSSVVKISARKNQVPKRGSINIVLLP